MSSVRRWFRLGLRLGVVAAVVAVVVRVVQSRRRDAEPFGSPTWPPVETTPSPAAAPALAADAVTPLSAKLTEVAPAAAPLDTTSAPTADPPTEVTDPGPLPFPTEEQGAGHPAAPEPAVRWVEPTDGVCPSSPPVKAKLSSGLFHLPGMAAYKRTRADRCYPDAESAAEDGLTRAKR